MPIVPTSHTLPEATLLPPSVALPKPIATPAAADDSHVARRTLADQRLIHKLDELSEAEDDYWTFRGRAARRRTHGLTQYPAMMVPAMQAVLIGTIADVDEDVNVVCDPFAGSGTTLVECMRLGIDYFGQDINPLAVLLCRTKAGPFHIRCLTSAVKTVIDRASRDRYLGIDADFPGLEKWFSPKASIELSRIRRAIRTIDNLWCRRVLWTGLAETVRLTCNSRTSTFKLHVRTSDELESRDVSPLITFNQVIADINKRVREESTALKEAGHLSSNGHYRGQVRILIGDSAHSIPSRKPTDLLVTSPPYGDNTTTVPYGQYSYLPLQWIDLEDISANISSECLATTHSLDTMSLGGSRKKALASVQSLRSISPKLDSTLRRLENLPPDRASKVAAFFRDLDVSLGVAYGSIRLGAYMIWTVGNRRVAGKAVPTDAILIELLKAKGAHFLTKIERKIPSKRMATRNTVASTMRSESILLFRKQ